MVLLNLVFKILTIIWRGKKIVTLIVIFRSTKNSRLNDIINTGESERTIVSKFLQEFSTFQSHIKHFYYWNSLLHYPLTD